MNKLFVSTLLFLLSFIVVESESCRGNKMDNLSAKKDDTVIMGGWGGEHIEFVVNDNGAEVDYDCAHGRINQPIVLDKNGKFNLAGTYVTEHGGPVRIDEVPNTRSAEYVGIVKDKMMILTVTLSDTKEVIGTFNLTYGSRPKVMKCR